MGSEPGIDPGAPRVSIVMPAYDEADAIEPDPTTER